MRPPFRSILLTSGCLLALAVPAAAQGAPRSMAECERLKNDLAYNQCLAMFGPPARNVGGGDGSAAMSAPVPVASTATIPGIPAVEEPEVQEGRRGRRSRYSRRNGRMSAAFTVGTVDDGGSVAESSSEAPRQRHRRRRR
ncbi:hypothetical protein ASG52_05245 [Methylobacterium sp. Leaf456]|uniref:hypothetical protein n=1 Tax=Methylobacterium sp. Leaf456 TaxID=1736382 RepID=UPI0006F48B9B|nr:hypothetical protein [Methylobacterium sp. Leaf456]KQT53521.1 hypothetical protein ASG52_05245 [Methylobacterium sp. Leaf456]